MAHFGEVLRYFGGYCLYVCKKQDKHIVVKMYGMDAVEEAVFNARYSHDMEEGRPAYANHLRFYKMKKATKYFKEGEVVFRIGVVENKNKFIIRSLDSETTKQAASSSLEDTTAQDVINQIFSPFKYNVGEKILFKKSSSNLIGFGTIVEQRVSVVNNNYIVELPNGFIVTVYEKLVLASTNKEINDFFLKIYNNFGEVNELMSKLPDSIYKKEISNINLIINEAKGA